MLSESEQNGLSLNGQVRSRYQLRVRVESGRPPCSQMFVHIFFFLLPRLCFTFTNPPKRDLRLSHYNVARLQYLFLRFMPLLPVVFFAGRLFYCAYSLQTRCGSNLREYCM